MGWSELVRMAYDRTYPFPLVQLFGFPSSLPIQQLAFGEIAAHAAGRGTWLGRPFFVLSFMLVRYLRGCGSTPMVPFWGR